MIQLPPALFKGRLEARDGTFSILSRQAIQGASFTSPQQLRQAIDEFVQAWNPQTAPFEWTKGEVHPKGFKSNYSNLCS